MSSLRTSMALALAGGLVCATAQAGDGDWRPGAFGPHQVEVLECSTAFVASTRPAPTVLSSVFLDNAWEVQAYVASPDGRTLLLPQPGGLRVLHDGQSHVVALPLAGQHPELAWHPDSRRVAVWLREVPPPREGYVAIARRALAVLDVARLPVAAGEPAPVRVVHRVAEEAGTAWSLDWSHDGQALLVAATELDPESNDAYGVVTRVGLDGQTARELVRVPGQLEFVLGGGVTPAASDRLVVGHPSGLLVTDEAGRQLEALASVPAAGVQGVARSGDRLLLHYRHAYRTTGPTFLGPYLLDLEPTRTRSPRSPEPLDEVNEVAGIAFSPRGTWATWATATDVRFRAPRARAETTVLVSIPARADGLVPEVRGFAWSADEAKLAITAGNRLWIYDVANQALYPVLEQGRFEDTFLSQPTWTGDRVVVTAFTSPLPNPFGVPAGTRPKGC